MAHFLLPFGTNLAIMREKRGDRDEKTIAYFHPDIRFCLTFACLQSADQHLAMALDDDGGVRLPFSPGWRLEQPGRLFPGPPGHGGNISQLARLHGRFSQSGLSVFSYRS